MKEVEPVRLREAVRGLEGKWVAIKNGVVVAAEESADKLHIRMKREGLSDATVMRVPGEGEPELVGLG